MAEVTTMEQYAQATSDRLGQMYAVEAGVEEMDAGWLAILGPILLQIITSLLGGCPKPPTPAQLAERAARPGLIGRIILANHTSAVLRQYPDVDIKPAAARSAILQWGASAGVEGATKMLALAKAVS